MWADSTFCDQGQRTLSRVLVLPLWALHSDPRHLDQALPHETEFSSCGYQHSFKCSFSVLINGIEFTSIWYIWNKRPRIFQRTLRRQLKQLATAKRTSCRYVHKRHMTHTSMWCHIWALGTFSSDTWALEALWLFLLSQGPHTMPSRAAHSVTHHHSTVLTSAPVYGNEGRDTPSTSEHHEDL